jgi:hypothetical protein
LIPASGRSHLDRHVHFECLTAIFATGNNTGLRDDMTRRTVICNLDAGVKRPDLRDFELEPLEIVLAPVRILNSRAQAATPSCWRKLAMKAGSSE